MGKKRSIISYDKLNIDQKKQLLRDFPDGYGNHLTSIMTANGDSQEALIWETDEIIYLVKITKAMSRPLDDDDDDDFDDLDIDKIADIKEDDVEDDEDDDFDEPADVAEEDEDEDE